MPSSLPKVVTSNYAMLKTDTWLVVAPAVASGQIQIQLPFDPDPGSVYHVIRALGSVEPNEVDVVVVGAIHGASGDTLYSIPYTNGGYHIGRSNETVSFTPSSQIPSAFYTDWLAFGGLGLETFGSPFVPNLAGSVIVPLTAFGPFSGDGGHPRTLYGVSLAVTPALTAGQLAVSPRMNGVALSPDVLFITPGAQPNGSRSTAGSPCAGPGVNFFTAQPGGFLFSPPAGGGILDLVVTASGGAAGPLSGIVTASIF